MRKKDTEVSLQYKMVLPLLLENTQLYDLVKTDSDRRDLIEVKYNLSKHTVYRFLKDYALDPDSVRWEHDDNLFLIGMKSFDITDKHTNVQFRVRIYTRSEEYHPRNIHVCINGNYDVLNDLERVYLCVVLDGINQIKRNLRDLKNQQNTLYERNNIKGMY